MFVSTHSGTTLASYGLSKEKFIKLCELRTEQSESITMKAKGRFASEETMRDIMKLKENLTNIICYIWLLRAFAKL